MCIFRMDRPTIPSITLGMTHTQTVLEWNHNQLNVFISLEQQAGTQQFTQTMDSTNKIAHLLYLK